MPSFRKSQILCTFFNVVAGVLLCGGCGSLPKPTAHVTGARLTDLKLDSANLTFDVAIENPYAVAMPLVNFDYTLASNGATLLSGSAAIQGTVPANGTSTVALPAAVDFAKVFATLKDVHQGSVIPYDATLKLSVSAPLIGKVSVPLEHAGQLPIPAVPVVELGDVQWKGLDLVRTEAMVHLHVTNPNSFALDLTRVTLGLNLGGHSIVSTGVNQPGSIAAGGDGMLAIPIGFSPKDLGLSAFSLLQGKGSDYHITGLVAANTPYGPLSFPYDRTGNTPFK